MDEYSFSVVITAHDENRVFTGRDREVADKYCYDIKAFYGCTNLREVYAGSRLEYLAEDAFAYCNSLTKFYSATPYAEDYVHFDDGAFNDTAELTIYCRHGSFLANSKDCYDYVNVSYIDHTVTWNNWDGDELEKDEYVLEGQMPAYGGATPVRSNSDNKKYTFTGWTPEVAPVTGDITYTATYSSRDASKEATYIDKNGESKTVTATILSDQDQYEYYAQAADEYNK